MLLLARAILAAPSANAVCPCARHMTESFIQPDH